VRFAPDPPAHLTRLHSLGFALCPTFRTPTPRRLRNASQVTFTGDAGRGLGSRPDAFAHASGRLRPEQGGRARWRFYRSVPAGPSSCERLRLAPCPSQRNADAPTTPPPYSTSHFHTPLTIPPPSAILRLTHRNAPRGFAGTAPPRRGNPQRSALSRATKKGIQLAQADALTTPFLQLIPPTSAHSTAH